LLRKLKEMSQEKDRIRNRVHRAVKSGKLIKPDHCQHCGLVVPCDKPHALQAHHEDYSRPLEVEWLCYHCHGWTDMVKQMKWQLSHEWAPGHEDLKKFFRKQLRIATRELKKLEWFNGIPEKYQT
jgi:hypothetical protein